MPFDFKGEITLGESLAILLTLIAAALVIWEWLRLRYGRFELRYLDPDEEVDPENEKRRTVLRMLPGTSVVRISLRSRTAIHAVRRLSFTAFDNRIWPFRVLPGFTGKHRVNSSDILAKKLRWQDEHGTFRVWEDMNITPRGSYHESIQPFVEGSRRIFEVEYSVAPSFSKWDGTLGLEVQYEDSGNNKHKYLNSKFFTGDHKRKPLTFRLRRTCTSKVVPDTESCLPPEQDLDDEIP